MTRSFVPPGTPTIVLVILLLLGLLGACGDRRGTSDAGDTPEDAGTADAGTADADTADAGSGLADAGAGDADLPPVDAGETVDGGPPTPATCPVGVADGCCPIALRYGGRDPDCAALDCAEATVSAPIVLDDPSVPTTSGLMGHAAVSWTGEDLIVAWAALNDAVTGSPGLWVQRRNASDGAVGRPARRWGDVTVDAWRQNGTAAVVWAPLAEQSLFVGFRGGIGETAPYGGVLMDDRDQPGASPEVGDAECSRTGTGFHHFVGAFDTGDRFLVSTVGESCSGGSHQLELTPVSYEGVVGTAVHQVAMDPLGLATAYDAVNRRVLMVWKDMTDGFLDLRGRFVDADTLALGEPFLVLALGSADVDHVRVGFDGERFGVVYSQHNASGFRTSFGVFDPDEGEQLTPSATLPSTRRLGQGRVAWTGAGWVVLTTTTRQSVTSVVPGRNTSVAGHELWLHRLDDEGALLEASQLDEGRTGVTQPEIAWANDRVALTWTWRTTEADQHLMALLSCGG